METKRYSPKVIEEDIVISGMSGRFPESNTTDEFAQNLYNNVDMITDDSRRWPSGMYGMDQRMGKLKDIEKFDGNFFGVINSIGDKIDPHLRILMETTYEAIVDAGVNPQSLRGSNTGVYIGYSTFGMPEGLPEEVQPDSQRAMTDTLLWVQGQAKCLYSNRISFAFDFKGPSLIIDTACSSSLVAFNTAMNDLRLGKCRQAIVGGTNVNLQPFTNHIFQSTRLNSSDGIPKVWDQRADGFVRGETIACFLLQRSSDAKRIYATVLNSGVNIDGNKRMGMFFPSAESQEELMIQVYKEVNVDPLEVNYFEAHATGTKVGDPQEAKAIYNAYCFLPKREGTLPIGLLKSNIGHAEGASGVSSVTKVLLAYERECIPANLHLNQIKSTIADMCPPLVPITENFKYTPGIAGVNNFGVGGVNAHVLLEPNYKVSDEDCLKIAETIPRIVNICGRTEQSLNEYFEFIEKNPNKISRDFLALLTDTMKTKSSLNTAGFPYRGSIFIKQMKDNNEIQYEYKKQFSKLVQKNVRPVWFLFPGLGGQWVGMAKALMTIKIFADKIEECHEILKPFGIDLKHLLLSDDPNSMSSMTNKFCATTALEIALFDVMKALNIIPDGIIGHSFGEIAAAYADGCLTTKESLFITYIRGAVTESDKKIPKGLMAVVGMSWKETKKLCPPGVSVVCNNGKDSVVVSGIYGETKELIETLNKKGIFVRELESHGIPYHSEYLMTCAQKMTDEIKKVLPNPKLRSKRWISTAVIKSEPKEELRYASAEYFVYNLISPVYFYNKINQMPIDAIVVELGPHSLFAKLVTGSLESSTYLSLIKRDSNDTNLDMFLGSIAKLYELGLNPNIENLYPKVEWPVARNTQSIGSLMSWDHNDNYYVRKYPDHHFKASASDLNESVCLSEMFAKCHLPDHCIDGNVIYPATGFLMLVWRHLASSKGRLWNQIPVVFEDVQFRRAVFLSDREVTRLKVRLFEQTGEFVVLENNNISCLGRVRCPDEDCLCVQSLLDEDDNEMTETEITIDTNDIYKDLRIMGYDYGPMFRGLKDIKTNDFQTIKGSVQWTGNWVTFMDSLLQTMAVGMPFRKMMVPVMIKSMKCDPKVLFNGVMDHRVEEVKEHIEDKLVEEVDKGQLQSGEESVLEANDSQKLLEEFVEQRYHIYKSILPFHVDMNSRMIVTHGVEIEDLMALPIPRKTNIQDLKLESYQFLANEEYNAIEESDKNNIREYLKVCSKLSIKIKQTLGLIDSNNTNTNGITEELVQSYLNDIKEDQILLKIFDKILKLMTVCKDENENFDKKLANSKVNAFVADLKNNPELDMSLDVINQVSKNEQLIRSLLDIVSENNVPKKEIKVLEMNLTNGLLAKEVDNHLASGAIYPIDVNYTIAVKAIDSISEDIRKKTFVLCEWDHKKNIFPSDIPPKDLIIFKDSQELWDLKLEDQIQEIHDILNEKGFLLSVFRTKLTEPELALNSMNGKKDLKDEDLEKRVSEYLSSAKKIGFALICSKFDSIGSMALLFRKVSTNPEVPNEKQMIEINNNFENWFELLKDRINESKENDQKFWLIGNDSSKNGILGLINCLRLEPGGEAIRCLFDCDNIIKLPIDFSEKPFSDILKNDLAVNVLKNGKIGSYRHLTLPKDYDKIQSNEYFLNVGHNRDLSSLQWFDSKQIVPKKQFYNISNNQLNQIRCQVYSSGINFRDVMLSTGRIASGPQMLFTDCVIGFEFAGRRSDTGVRVMGFDMSRCFATSVDASEDLITSIPDHWSMDDAITILCTYSTVWYGLIERGHLRKNESILIHSGCGGVGQSAIRVCQYYGCDIFVTVGTEEKKKFLMNEYNIPENRIFSSRDILFKYKIKALTKGKGVNLVLNSLTGDKLEASYECVADCGRFVEIGKYDLQMNKQLGMFSFLRDISFIGVSVDRKMWFENEFTQRFFDWMKDNCNNGMIKPINRTVFRAEEAEKAFRYMTTGKHIGKIVIKIRDEESDRKPLIAIKPAMNLKTTTKTYFNPNKVYIITGGLGGFGLELLHWMLFMGARKFVLTSRKGATAKYQKYVLKRIESLGLNFKMFETNIIVSTHDSNTSKGAQSLIEEANKLGPIGGVFHLALVLNDCLLENHTIEKFTETIDSKTKTFENLDKISRELDISLDYFVVFSSISCGKGNAGQSNYGYANSVCERICEQRRRDGLHGLAIQWGPIGDVGVLAETDVVSSLAGIVKQRINCCLDILDKLLQTRETIVSCVVRAKRVTQSGTREAKIVAQIWQALGIDPNTTPDHLTLGEIGMESMFAVELQQGLERDYDIKLTLNDIKNISVKNMKDFESGKKEVLGSYANEIRIAREKLTKVKFVIPTEKYTKLNSVTTGKPVYFLPPLEGIFASLEGLAEKINRPVIGLNWIKDMEKMSSLKEISRYYINLLKTLEPKGDYDIVGHFYGALIAMKMLKKAPIGRAVIIDSLSETQMNEELLSDEYLLELIVKFISKDLPIVVKEKLLRDLKMSGDVDTKLNKLSFEVKEFVGKSLVSKHLDDILRNSFKRAKLFTTYRLNLKNKFKQMKYSVGKKYLEMNGKLLIIKPFESNEDNYIDDDITDRIKDSYFLPEKGLEGKLNFQTVNENPDDLAFDKISESINQYLNTSYKK